MPLGQYTSCSAAKANNGQHVELLEIILQNFLNKLTPQTVYRTGANMYSNVIMMGYYVCPPPTFCPSSRVDIHRSVCLPLLFGIMGITRQKRTRQAERPLRHSLALWLGGERERGWMDHRDRNLAAL